jgi:hypothetical protein
MQSRAAGIAFFYLLTDMRYRLSYYINVTASVLFVLITVTMILPFTLPHHYILSSVPACKYKTAYNKECISCGLTHSFCEISNGNFKEAIRHNSASLLLFGVFLLYQILFTVYIIKYNYNKIFN